MSVPEPGLALGDERGEALDHGLMLIRDAWRSFDAPRPAQPAVSRQTLGLLGTALPEHGLGVRVALDHAAAVLDESLAQSRPRFFGYVGSSGLESSVLADAMAASHDVNLAGESAAAQLVEHQTLLWVGRFVGFPAAGGAFTSGGMLSNLTALMAARTRALPDSRQVGLGSSRPVVYCSIEAHSSVERAVEVLGIGRHGMRAVPLDADRRMNPAALKAMMAQDLAHGCTPVAVIATAGTTLTGAVDPIRAIGEVCQEHGTWLHVDGAYGLPAASTEIVSGLFDGLELADSVSLDAHKWMFVPKACGVLLVRDPSTLLSAFQHDASYMIEEEGYLHPVDWTMEYSRPFRSLKLWTALRAHGAEAFRQAITRNIELARDLARMVADSSSFELLVEPQLSTVPFRRVPASGEVNDHNMRLARALQKDGRVFVTSAVVDGLACLRPCIVNFRTTIDDVRAILDVADELGARLESDDPTASH
jgi:aromatic-L-amino-acid/L-tryptophan decarboxylase